MAIVGAALALHLLEIERVFASPLPTGMGMARHDHGMVPVPSPVVMELLKGAPTYSRGIPVELITPAGAAFLAAVVEGFGEMPLMRADRIGYGAGPLRLDFPNVLRVAIGEEEDARGGLADQEILLQVRLGEAGPQSVRAMLGEILDAGAVDAWVVPVIGADGEPAASVHAVVTGRTEAHVRDVLRSRTGGADVRAMPFRPSR